MIETQHNIFLSWSEKKSNAIAYIFNKFLPFIIQESRPFFSPEGIKKDQNWFNKIKSELISTKTGIVFLTKENLSNNWILFESGGIFTKDSLCVLLCDLDVNYLKEQDSLFQYFNATILNNKGELLKLFQTINGVISPSVIPTVIGSAFEKYYNEFWSEIQQGLTKTTIIEKNTTIFEGKWNLKYTMRNNSAVGGENLRLTDDGKYFLEEGNTEMYYFQLNILKYDSKTIIWQKLRVIDDKPTGEVHSVEHLQIGTDKNTLVGEDTIGFKLIYKKV